MSSNGPWSAAADPRISIALGSEPYSLITRSDCDDPADDALTPFPNPDFTPTSYTTAEPQPYVVDGNQLTVGGPGGTVLTRQ